MWGSIAYTAFAQAYIAMKERGDYMLVNQWISVTGKPLIDFQYEYFICDKIRHEEGKEEQLSSGEVNEAFLCEDDFMTENISSTSIMI